jgi:hypothetical protein
MNKFIVFFFLPFFVILNIALANTTDIFCNFEEVYQNGQIQEGLLMIKDSKIRYEYKNKNLYTIFVDHDRFTLIQNFDKKTKHLIKPEKKLFNVALDLIKKYPAKIDEYKEKGFDIRFEKSQNFDFYKRISIKSEKNNMSIFFYNCQNGVIEAKYFNLDPVFEIRN